MTSTDDCCARAGADPAAVLPTVIDRHTDTADIAGSRSSG